MTRIAVCRPASCSPAFASVARAQDRAARGRDAGAQRERAAGGDARAQRGRPASGRRAPARSIPAGELAEEAPARRAADLVLRRRGAAALGDGAGLDAEPVHQAERPAVVVGNRHRVLPAQGELRPRAVAQLPEHVAARRQLAGQGPQRQRSTPTTSSSTASRCGALDVSFIWHTMFTEWFGMHYGAGIGVGIVAGDILRTSNDPRSAPTATRATSRSATRSASRPNGSGGIEPARRSRSTPGPDDPTNPHRFADPNVPPALPIVNLVVGFDFRLPQVRGWEAQDRRRLLQRLLPGRRRRLHVLDAPRRAARLRAVVALAARHVADELRELALEAREQQHQLRLLNGRQHLAQLLDALVAAARAAWCGWRACG